MGIRKDSLSSSKERKNYFWDRFFCTVPITFIIFAQLVNNDMFSQLDGRIAFSAFAFTFFAVWFTLGKWIGYVSHLISYLWRK